MLSDNIINRSLKLGFLTGGKNNKGGCFGTFYPRTGFLNQPLKIEKGKIFKSPYAVKMIFDEKGESYFVPDIDDETSNPYEIKTIRSANGFYKIVSD